MAYELIKITAPLSATRVGEGMDDTMKATKELTTNSSYTRGGAKLNGSSVYVWHEPTDAQGVASGNAGTEDTKTFSTPEEARRYFDSLK